MSFGNCFLSKALLLLWSCINGREKNGQDFQVNVCINVCSNMGPRLSFQILTRQFSKIFFFFFFSCICPKFQILIHVDGKEKQISEKGSESVLRDQYLIYDANISQHSLWMFCTIIFYADQRRSSRAAQIWVGMTHNQIFRGMIRFKFDNMTMRWTLQF